MTFNELLALDEAKKAKASGPRDTAVSRHRDTTIPSVTTGAIAEAVARVGKEAATHRLTREEKEAVAKAIYEYGQQGWKTSENEIVRIGVNWLLADHASRKEASVLHKVLKELRE